MTYDQSDIDAMAADLTRATGLRVELDADGAKLRIVIEANNLDQIDEMCRRLMGGPPLTEVVQLRPRPQEGQP